MAESEKFDIKKLVTSPFTGLYWTKVIMYGLGILVLLIVSYAIYKAYIKKPDASQAIHAESGSNVTVIQSNQKKKALIPFIELGVEKNNETKYETYMRGGIRWEF